MWKARGRVPAEHCPSIEAATGIRCEDLRPDVNWSVLRGTAQQAETKVEQEAA
jgi:DNA-binding transcriptional regulator YdaS (Cro superfamily)